MSTHQALIPEHLKEFQKIVKKWFSTQRILEDLHTRTCPEHPGSTFMQAPMQSIFQSLMRGGFQQDLHKIFSQGPVGDQARTPRGFHQNLFKIFSQGPVQDHALQGPLRGFHQDLYKIYSHGVEKDLDPGLHARTPKRIPQDHAKRTCCCWRGSYKTLIQENPKSLLQELSYKHL